MGSERWRAVGDARRVEFSPDGKLLAGVAGGLIHVWDATTGRVVEFLRSPDARAASSLSFTELAFSPDGRLIAAGRSALSRESVAVDVFDLQSGELRRTMTLQEEANAAPGARDRGVESLLFTHDGKSLITGGADGSIRLWSVETGDELLVRKWPEIQGGPRYRPDGTLGARLPPFRIVDVALSPDGRTLAAVADCSILTTTSLTLWTLGAERPTRVIDSHRSFAQGVAFSPDGRRVYSGGHVERATSDEVAAGARSGLFAGVRIWDVETGERVGELRSIEEDAFVYDLALLPDGKTLVVKYNRHVIRLWDVESGREIAKLQGERDNITGRFGIALSPDGRRLASAGPGAAVRMFDLSARAPINADADAESHDGAVTRLAFTPDGAGVVSLARDNAIRVWDAASGAPRRAIRADSLDARPTIFALSPDGRDLTAIGFDGAATVWEVATGRAKLRIEPDDARFTSIAYSPDGRRLALGLSPSPNAAMLRGRRGRGSNAATPAPDEQTVAVEIRDAASGEVVGRILGRNVESGRLWFDRAGARLIGVGGRGGTARVWDAASGALRFRFETGDRLPAVHELLPDGAHLISMGGIQTSSQIGDRVYVGVEKFEAVIRSLATGEAERRFTPPHDSGHLLALALDGRRAATLGSSSRSIHILDLSDGRELHRIESGRGPRPSSLAISPDGRTFAAGMSNGTILIYPMPPE
jgi:WD40 repeat protein